MTRLVAWVDGRLTAVGEATVSVFDRGFRWGEGVFETLRVYGTHPFALDAHLERACAGLEALGVDPPPTEALTEAVQATVVANRPHLEGDFVIRLTITPGRIDPASPHPGTPVGTPTVVVTAHPLVEDPAIYREGVTATVVSWHRELPHLKSLSAVAALLARRQAAQRGAFEALLTDHRAYVLEGSSSNVFAVLDGRLVTPPVAAGLLGGVTRALVLELAPEEGIPTEERPVTVTELGRADEVLLTSSTREVVPVVRIDAVRVGDGRPGPIAAALHEAYRSRVRQHAVG